MSGSRARRDRATEPGVTPPPTGYVIRVIALAGFTLAVDRLGNPAGKLVAAVDVDAHDGRGELVLVDEPERAQVFPSFADAWETWQQQSTTRPYRPDGKPNRPGTAYTVGIEPAPPGAGSRHTGR